MKLITFSKEPGPHVQEMPSHPTFFSKAPTTVLGPCDDIAYDADLTDKLDWEAELALVIGAGGRTFTKPTRWRPRPAA